MALEPAERPTFHVPDCDTGIADWSTAMTTGMERADVVWPGVVKNCTVCGVLVPSRMV